MGQDVGSSNNLSLSTGMLEFPTVQPQPGRAPIAVDVGGKHLLLPFDGDFKDDKAVQAAIDRYKQTGQHLGVFDNQADAVKYGQVLATWQPPTQQGGAQPNAPSPPPMPTTPGGVMGGVNAVGSGMSSLGQGIYEGQAIHPQAIGQQAVDLAGPVGLAAHDLAAGQATPGQAAATAVSGVKTMGGNMLLAQGQLYNDARDAYAQGDYTTAIRKIVDWAIPMFGPGFAHAGDTVQHAQTTNDILRGYGQYIGNALNLLFLSKSRTVADAAGGIAAGDSPLGRTAPGQTLPSPPPQRLMGIPGIEPENLQPPPAGTQVVPGGQRMAGVGVTPGGGAPMSPAAVAQTRGWAQDNKVPIPAGTATGNPVMRTVQDVNARTSLGGAFVDQRMRQNFANRMQQVGTGIADQTGAPATSPVAAGEAVRTQLGQVLAELRATANKHYAAFHAQAQGIPVNLAQAKAILKPIYDRLNRQWVRPLAPPKERALNALKQIVEGPDLASADDVDANLSTLKYLARTQGDVSKKAVGEVEGALQRALATHPDVRQSLANGRAAIQSSAEARDLLEQLAGKGGDKEPYAIYKRLTGTYDGRVDLLARIQKTRPDLIPIIGRAMLQEMLDKGFHEPGTFDHAAALYANWEKIGPATRKILFPTTAKDITLFFRTAADVAKSSNPSGSGYVAALTAKVLEAPALWLINPLSNIGLELGQTVLARVLWSNGGAQVLAKALMTKTGTPVGASVAAQALNAARAAGVVIQSAKAPAAAQQPSPQQPDLANRGIQVGPYSVRAGQ